MLLIAFGPYDTEFHMLLINTFELLYLWPLHIQFN